MFFDYFIDSDRGSPSNSGSITSPWSSFDDSAVVAMLAAAQPRTRIFLAGTFRPSYPDLNTYTMPYLTGRTDVQMRQWEGKAAAIIRADAALTGAVWTNVSGDVWQTTLVPGLGSPSGMTVAYDASTWTSNGAVHRFGVCKTVASTGLVTSTQWSFNYNNSTGETRLHCPGHNPNVSAVTMVREGASYNLCTLTDCIGCVVSGLEGRVSGINLTGGAFGFALNGCSDCKIEGCLTADTADHGFASLGTTNTNNTFQGCIALGGGWTATNFVMYAAGTAYVVNAQAIDCVAHVLNYLNGSNTELYAVGEISVPTMQGFFGHTNTANHMQSVLFDGCSAYVYMPSAGAAAGGSYRNGFGIADTAVFAGVSALDKTGRAARYRRCRSRGDTYLSIGNQLFEGCSFYFDNAGPAMSTPSGFIYCTGGGGSVLSCVAYFEGCEIIANMDRTSGSESGVIGLAGTYAVGEGPSFINCTILNTGTNGTTSYLFDYNSKANLVMRAHQCVLGHTGKTGGLCAGDTSLPAGVHAFRSNSYTQILDATFGFSLNASFYTFANWKSTVDTSAVPIQITPTNLGLTGITVNASLSLGTSAIRGLTVTNVTPATIFMNEAADASIPGAWQYPRRQSLPSSMVQAGSWVDEAAGSANLHLKIDDVLPDTSDFVENGYAGGTLIVGLPTVIRPRSLSEITVRTCYQYADGPSNFVLTITLREGTLTRATRTITVDVAVTDWVFDVWNIPLSSINVIQDFSNLRLGFTVTSTGVENVSIASVNLETDNSTGFNIPLPQQRHLNLLSQ